MSKKMDWYILHDDFEGAKERLETTSPSWKARWFEVCKQIFESNKEWAKTYVLLPFEKAVAKIDNLIDTVKKKGKRSKYDEKIFVADNCDLKKESNQKCYLFEFLDDDDKMICSKVGTTIRDVIVRLREELDSKTYKKMGAEKAIIHRVYDCGDVPAEGLESYFRANYIKKYPDSFKKNDRFMGLKFDLLEADKIYADYFNL